MQWGRLNRVALFAFTRMAGSDPASTPRSPGTHAGSDALNPAKIAPFTLALLSEQAREVKSQVFVVRSKEFYLMSQRRTIRTARNDAGWTVGSCLAWGHPDVQAGVVPTGPVARRVQLIRSDGLRPRTLLSL